MLGPTAPAPVTELVPTGRIRVPTGKHAGVRLERCLDRTLRPPGLLRGSRRGRTSGDGQQDGADDQRDEAEYRPNPGRDPPGGDAVLVLEGLGFPVGERGNTEGEQKEHDLDHLTDIDRCSGRLYPRFSAVIFLISSEGIPCP